jgi:Pretoxin HINT domain/Restriction endonuclease fold toxin 7
VDGAVPSQSSLRLGDMVLSRDAETGRTAMKPVVDQFRRVTPTLIHLALEASGKRTEVITTTPEHPFHVPGHGFVEAGKLTPGMLISRAPAAHAPLWLAKASRANDVSGALLVKALTREDRPETVYNITVADTHTYFVGKSQAWVHNADLCVPDAVVAPVNTAVKTEAAITDAAVADAELVAGAGSKLSDQQKVDNLIAAIQRTKPDFVYEAKAGSGAAMAADDVSALKGVLVQENYAAGRAFQNGATKLMEVPENTTVFRSSTLSGEARNTIPDAMANAVVEIKSGQAVYNTSQIQAQMNLAKETGVPYLLVVSESTHVSGPVLEAIELAGGQVLTYSPGATKLMPRVKK